jgi:hypothetical protein
LATENTSSVSAVTSVDYSGWSTATDGAATLAADITVTGADGVTEDTITVELVDSEDEVIASATAEWKSTGVYTASFSIPASAASVAGTYNVRVNGYEDATGHTVAAAAEGTGAWDTYGFNFSDEDAVIGLNQTYLLLNVTNPFDGGKVVDPTTYKVFYFKADGTPVAPSESNDPSVVSDNTEYGTHPKTDAAATYYVAVVNSAAATVESTTTLDSLRAQYPTHVQKFTVKKATEALGTVTAYEYDASKAADEQNTADSDFVYTGEDVTVGFAIDGKALEGKELTLTWTAAPEGVALGSLAKELTNGAVTLDAAKAGTYRATVTGNGTLNGSATVEFTIDPLDLSAMTLTAADVTAGPAVAIYNGSDDFKVDNKSIAPAAFEVSLPVFTAVDGTVSTVGDFMAAPGAYAYTLTAPAGSTDVTGSQVVTVKAFETAPAEYKYGSNITMDADDDADFATFVTAFGEAFNPSAINVDGKFSGFEVTVTKGGVATEDYSQPGKYSVTVKVSTEDYSYGGSITDTFSVKASNFNPADCEVYIAVDGKVNPGSVSYDGQGHPVTAVVKDADGNTLTEGEDYELVLENGEGEAIESAVDVADGYKAYVTFPGFDNREGEITFNITKATISQVRPTADFFATDGTTAAVPSFEGSTAAAGKKFESGDVFALAAGEISVSYKTAKWTDADNDGSVDDGELAAVAAVDASDLTVAGWYQATITVLNSSATLKGQGVECFFQVLEQAAYNDVPADAWYAESVYKAREEGYMEGVAAGVFAPEQAMTRAEFAKLVANMAGYGYSTDASYPTQFTDVPADAWFAGAVEWAARYGIVKGTSETTFDPYGTITREEIATMLYRYAGNNAQADASALDAFVDGAQVSDWAENAMAWAVEEGYMNGKGANDLQPQATATRAEIAALAVRVQPEAL